MNEIPNMQKYQMSTDDLQIHQYKGTQTLHKTYLNF